MLPQGFPERMLHLLGEAEFAEFLASYERPRSAGLRLNPRKPLPDGASLPFCEAQVPWEPNGYYVCEGSRPGLHPWHDAGAYYLQEPSAMAPARLLDAQPGERVLDLCAAPGGKTTQLAAAMQGRGLLVCNEIHPRRAQVLASNIERLGIPNALVLSEHPAKLAQRFPGYFDRILVDAPCSGEGMFRKEEAAVTDWSEATVAMCAARQQEILASAAEMLAPGGRLVYSTCTFSPEENEGVISAFLHAHPAFSVEPVEAPWFSPARPDWIDDPPPGLPSASGRTVCAARATLPPSCAAMRTAHGRMFPRNAPLSSRQPPQTSCAAARSPCRTVCPSASAPCAIWPRQRRPPFPACACFAPVWSWASCAVTASPPPTRWRSGCTPTRRRRISRPAARRSPPICAARRCTARSAAGRC